MNEIRYPDRIRSCFQAEKHSLILITLSGLVYNIGLLAGPLFEGKLMCSPSPWCRAPATSSDCMCGALPTISTAG